jgi:hypothetical protein
LSQSLCGGRDSNTSSSSSRQQHSISLGNMRDSDDAAAGRRAEIYTYESNTLVYAMNWSVSDEPAALCSCSARKQHVMACVLAVQQRICNVGVR